MRGYFPLLRPTSRTLSEMSWLSCPPPPNKVAVHSTSGRGKPEAPVDPDAEQIFTYSLPNPFQGWFGIPHDVLTEEKWVFCLRAYLS